MWKLKHHDISAVSEPPSPGPTFKKCYQSGKAFSRKLYNYKVSLVFKYSAGITAHQNTNTTDTHVPNLYLTSHDDRRVPINPPISLRNGAQQHLIYPHSITYVHYHVAVLSKSSYVTTGPSAWICYHLHWVSISCYS